MWKTVCDKERWCVKRWYVCMYVMFCTMQPQILRPLSACPVAGNHPYGEGRKDKGGGEGLKVWWRRKGTWPRERSKETSRNAKKIDCKNTKHRSRRDRWGAQFTVDRPGCDHCFRTWCSATAASARWSRYLAEQNKTTDCLSCQETATLSWRLSVLESQTDNRHVNHRLITVSFGKPKTWTKPSSWTELKTNMGWQKATASTASSGNQARLQGQPSAISATPATQSEGGCHQVPRLPRKNATQSGGPCRQVPRLPRKVTVDVTKCHACHAKWRWMSPNAAPATQSEGGCRQVPRLPRKKPRRPRRHLGTKRAYRASPVP